MDAILENYSPDRAMIRAGRFDRFPNCNELVPLHLGRHFFAHHRD